MALLNLPLEQAYEYDVKASDTSRGGMSMRRQRFPIAKARRRFKLTYGPTTYTDAATILADFDMAMGAAAVSVSGVGTGRYGDSLSIVFNSPTACFLEVDFIIDAEFT